MTLTHHSGGSSRSVAGRLHRIVRSSFGGLPQAFWYMWLGVLVNRVCTFVTPFLMLYLTLEQHISASTAGLVISVQGVMLVVSRLLGGSLVDRFGPQKTMVGGLVASAIAMALLASASELPAVTLGVALVGLTQDIFRPASSSLTAAIVPQDQLNRAYSLLTWAVYIGFATSGVLAAVLLQAGYRVLFLCDAATCLLFALIVMWRVRIRSYSHRRPEGNSGSYLPVARDARLVMLTVLSFVSAFLSMQAFVGLPLSLTAAQQDPSTLGVLFAVNGGLILLLQPFAAPLLDRFPPMVVLAVSIALQGFGFGLTGLCEHLWQFSGAVAVWSLGQIVAVGFALREVNRIARKPFLGRYLGFYGLGWGVAALAAPIIGGATFQFIGSWGLWVGCAVLGVLGAAGYLTLNRRFQTTDAAASADIVGGS